MLARLRRRRLGGRRLGLFFSRAANGGERENRLRAMNDREEGLVVSRTNAAAPEN